MKYYHFVFTWNGEKIAEQEYGKDVVFSENCTEEKLIEHQEEVEKHLTGTGLLNMRAVCALVRNVYRLTKANENVNL